MMVTETLLLFRRSLVEQLHKPIWIITELTTPLLYLALFAPLLGDIPAFAGSGGDNAFVSGLLALFAFSSGTDAGWVVIFELQAGIGERFRVTPVSRFSLLMGNVLKDVVVFLVPALIVVAVAGYAGFDVHLGGLAVLLVLLCMLNAIVSAWSCSLGLLLKDIGSLAGVVTGLQLPIMLLAGVLLPVSLGPKWLRVLAHFNPLYYVVEASRALAAGNIGHESVLIAFAVIVPLLALTLVWATNVYSKAIT